MEDKVKNGFFAFGSYRLNPIARILMHDDSVLPIGSRAFDMLVALVQRQGEVVSRRDLMAYAWPGLNVEDSNVRVQMAHLRREIGCGENDNRYIVSVAGRGYCFVAQAQWHEAADIGESGNSLVNRRAMATEIAIASTAKLPPRLDRALGRDENIAELAHAIEERRFVTVVGPGGIGKTTLVVLVAHLLDRFQSIEFVDLSMVDDGAMVVDAVAAAVGLAPTGSDPLSDLLAYLCRHRSLVILDNCEHVIDAVAELVDPILRHAPAVHILATSREAFRIPGEAVYLLRPLGVPPHTGRLTARQALAWPSVQLFVEQAIDGGHLEPLADEQAATVAAICRRLEGNPLAIELVASRIGTYGVDRVADLLDNQLALRWRGSRYAAPRHQTVESMLDWSYALLSDIDQKVLRRLSVFAGEFSLDAAVAVAGDEDFGPADIVDAIGNLVDKSLLAFQAGKGPAQLRLLGMTRTYAAMKLSESGERAAIHQRQSFYSMEKHRPQSIDFALPADSDHETSIRAS